jgi:hypothetical protein
LPFTGYTQSTDETQHTKKKQSPRDQSNSIKGITPGSTTKGKNDKVGDGCVNACVTGVAYVCMEGFIQFMGAVFQQMGTDQNRLMHERDSIPELQMLEIMPQAAFALNNGTLTMLPRVRGVLGLFSTDFRICQRAETNASAAVYSTFDWSVIQYGLINTKNYHLRLGTGFMHERYSRIYYNEHFIGNDIKWSNRINSNIEFRMAMDYTNGIKPRSEINFRTNIELTNRKPFHIYYTLGGLYQNYSHASDYWSVQSGFLLRLE